MSDNRKESSKVGIIVVENEGPIAIALEESLRSSGMEVPWTTATGENAARGPAAALEGMEAVRCHRAPQLG